MPNKQTEHLIEEAALDILSYIDSCSNLDDLDWQEAQGVIGEILTTIATRSADGRQAEIMQRLQAVEAIAEDEQKHRFAEHCPCLRYAIWRVENPDADEMVYASTLSKTKE